MDLGDSFLVHCQMLPQIEKEDGRMGSHKQLFEVIYGWAATSKNMECGCNYRTQIYLYSEMLISDIDKTKYQKCNNNLKPFLPF